MTEATVTLNFRVTDRALLVETVYRLLQSDPAYSYDDITLENFSDADFIELIIDDRIDGWLNIGLERID